MNPGRRLLAILALLGLLAPVGADAQRLGTRIGHEARAKDGPEMLRLMAECFASRQPDLVRRWLDMLPGSREEHDFLVRNEPELSTCTDDRKIVMDGKEISFKAATFRRPVALAAARRRLQKAPAALPVAANSDPWFMPKLKPLSAGDQLDRAALTLIDFGHCVATHDWQGSLAILGAEPKSAEERQAVAHLRPVLGPCLPADAKVTLTTDNLREIVAEPVLHILDGEVAVAEAGQ